MKHALVKEVLPALSKELHDLLEKEGRTDLVAQVEELPLMERCRCGDNFCSTFYTAPRPNGGYGLSHYNLELEPRIGMIILDLVDDEIRCIEILNRPDVQRELFAFMP